MQDALPTLEAARSHLGKVKGASDPGDEVELSPLVEPRDRERLGWRLR